MIHSDGELHGLPVRWLETRACRVALSLHGGQLLSFTPTGSTDYLWLTPRPKSAPGAIRGGVPVCWPYFGREGQLPQAPQHGFARATSWRLDQVAEDEEGAVRVFLSLPEDPSTSLRLQQQWVLRADGFSQALITHNPSAEPIAFTQALHSYFAVSDANQVQLQGVAGLLYADNYDGQLHLQRGDWDLHDARDPGRSDRKYQRATGEYLLQDPVGQRALRIRSQGSASLVVWNPGAGGVAALGDVPADDWRRFVCVEVANAGEDIIMLAPGASHRLQQTVQALPLA